MILDHACVVKNSDLAVELLRYLRHTWASWHVHAGTPPLALKQLGGWQTWERVKRPHGQRHTGVRKCAYVVVT